MQKARRRPLRLRPLVDIRFQVLFTLLLAVLFTFPSRYLCTIGLSVVFSLSGWCRYIHARILQPRATPSPFHLRLQDFHLLRSTFPSRSAWLLIRWGSSDFARHYSRNPFFSFFSSRYLDVSVPRVRAFATGLQPVRFPHSDIYGLTVVCTSPQLFAAYHVLHRLWEPRHPPYALIHFLSSFFLLSNHINISINTITSRSYSFCLSCMSNNFLLSIFFETAAEM